MLNCTICDYYSNDKGKKVCEFADYLFLKNPADMDSYPCKDISYDSYLSKSENKEDVSIVA